MTSLGRPFETTTSSSDTYEDHDEPTVVVLVKILLDTYYKIKRDLQINMRQNMHFRKLIPVLKAETIDDQDRRLECKFIKPRDNNFKVWDLSAA
jgi:hypothetical protein